MTVEKKRRAPIYQRNRLIVRRGVDIAPRDASIVEAGRPACSLLDRSSQANELSVIANRRQKDSGRHFNAVEGPALGVCQSSIRASDRHQSRRSIGLDPYFFGAGLLTRMFSAILSAPFST